MTQRSGRMLLSAARPSAKPMRQASTPAATLICSVTTVPRASSGIAIWTMLQSIVTSKLLPPKSRSFPRTRESRAKFTGPSVVPWVPALAGTSGIDVDSIQSDHGPGSAEARDRVRELHFEAEPFLLHRVDLAALLHRLDPLVDELAELGVFLAEAIAVPIVAADILHHGERTRLVAQHDAERRHGVEHAIDAPLREGQIGRRMIVVGLDVLEAGATLRLELRLELDLQRLAGRSELDAEHLAGHVGDGLDLVLVGRADQQRLRGVGVGDA